MKTKYRVSCVDLGVEPDEAEEFEDYHPEWAAAQAVKKWNEENGCGEYEVLVDGERFFVTAEWSIDYRGYKPIETTQ